MDYLLIIVVWIVGIGAGAIFVVQPMIVLFFGIPFTLRLKRLGVIVGSGPIPVYVGSLLILPVLFGLITWGVLSWLPKHMIAYWVGVGFTMLMGLGKCGATSTNIGEYLDTNSQFFDPDALNQMRANLESKGVIGNE